LFVTLMCSRLLATNIANRHRTEAYRKLGRGPVNAGGDVVDRAVG
jgi:hypothetical protein